MSRVSQDVVSLLKLAAQGVIDGYAPPAKPGTHTVFVDAETLVSLTTEVQQLRAAYEQVRLSSRDGRWYFTPNDAEAFIELLPEPLA